MILTSSLKPSQTYAGCAALPVLFSGLCFDEFLEGMTDTSRLLGDCLIANGTANAKLIYCRR